MFLTSSKSPQTPRDGLHIALDIQTPATAGLFMTFKWRNRGRYYQLLHLLLELHRDVKVALLPSAHCLTAFMYHIALALIRSLHLPDFKHMHNLWWYWLFDSDGATSDVGVYSVPFIAGISLFSLVRDPYCEQICQNQNSNKQPWHEKVLLSWMAALHQAFPWLLLIRKLW